MSSGKSNSIPLGGRSYLKRRNAGYLWSFIGVNLAMFLSVFITKGFSASSIDHLWKGVTAKNGVIAACIPLLTIVLGGLVADQMKARLVFWRWRNPLPGCRVFTELIPNDTRIDLSALKKKYGELPCDPKEQNTLWYRVYKKHSGNVIVTEAHKNFLLTRDMTALAAIFFVVFSVAIRFDFVPWKVEILYLLGLIAQYLIMAISAQNYGKRFVLNVLAEDSHTGESRTPRTSRRKNPGVAEPTGSDDGRPDRSQRTSGAPKSGPEMPNPS